MITVRTIGQGFIKLLPLFILYFLSLNSFAITKTIPHIEIFSFNVQIIIIYFYVLRLPEYLGFGHVFLIGILKDVLTGTPLGATAVNYLVLCVVATEWFMFIPALFFSNFAYFAIINNFSNLVFYYEELLRISFFTFLFFPIFYPILNSHRKLYKVED
jgi:cell shape-determining protein MreD